MIKLNLKRKNKEIEIDLILKSRVYVDTVFEVAPIEMLMGDTFQVTYNLEIGGYVDGRLTSTLREKFSYIFEIKKDVIVKFIRFTKFNENANIQCYNKMPLNFYLPKKFNATKAEMPEDIEVKKLKKRLTKAGLLGEKD